MSELQVNTIKPYSPTSTRVTITPGLAVKDILNVDEFKVTDTGEVKLFAPLFVGNSQDRTVNKTAGKPYEVLTSRGSSLSPRWEPGVPFGGIVMWNGNHTEIPNGWALCDGRTVGGYTTPDLRDRFIIGAGAVGGLEKAGTRYPVGSKGGSETTVIKSLNLPNGWANHRHAYGSYASCEPYSGNPLRPYVQTALNRGGCIFKPNTDADAPYTLYGGELEERGKKGKGKGGEYQNSGAMTAYTSVPKSNVNATTMTADNTYTGSGDVPIDRRPLFYALCYIMRVPTL